MTPRTFFETWGPVTHDMGLIAAPLSQLRDAFVEWQIGLGHPHTATLIDDGFGTALARLAPLSAGKKRRLFVETSAGWTAQFQSGIQGSDPSPVMSVFAQRFGVLAMRVCATPRSAKYPAVIWEVYAPPHLGGTVPGGSLRSIAAANDGGRWVFEQSGEPFPFESLETYSLPRKRDRFTRSMLAAYLGEFSLQPFDDHFYVVDRDHPAILLERPRYTLAEEPREFSLEEVESGLPWKR